MTYTTHKRIVSTRAKIVCSLIEKEQKMTHYGCNVDVTQEPFYCSDHEVYLNDEGEEL